MTLIFVDVTELAAQLAAVLARVDAFPCPAADAVSYARHTGVRRDLEGVLAAFLPLLSVRYHGHVAVQIGVARFDGGPYVGWQLTLYFHVSNCTGGALLLWLAGPQLVQEGQQNERNADADEHRGPVDHLIVHFEEAATMAATIEHTASLLRWFDGVPLNDESAI